MKLSEIATIRAGITLRSREARKGVADGAYRLLRIGDLNERGEFDLEKALRVDPDVAVDSELLLRQGDVLLPSRGGRLGAAVFDHEADNVLVGNQFWIVRVRSEEVLPEYVALSLNSRTGREYLATVGGGNLVKVLRRQDVEDLEIPLLPLEEQRKLVALERLMRDEQRLLSELREKKRLLNERLIQGALTGQFRFKP